MLPEVHVEVRVMVVVVLRGGLPGQLRNELHAGVINDVEDQDVEQYGNRRSGVEGDDEQRHERRELLREHLDRVHPRGHVGRGRDEAVMKAMEAPYRNFM